MVTMDYDPSASGNESYILCADCGTVISSANGAGLCESDSGEKGVADERVFG